MTHLSHIVAPFQKDKKKSSFFLKTIIKTIRSAAMVVESLMDLPLNILEEIISKLPIKTILACRCVCKTLLNLTSNSNQHFAALHSQNATQSYIIQFDCHLTLDDSVYLFDAQTDINPAGGELRLSPIYTPDLDTLKLGNLYLVNACNCLIYFAPTMLKRYRTADRSLVCNPITKECIVIPELDMTGRIQISSSWLGFSPTSRVYKILMIYATSSPLKLSTCVHDVGTISTWRDIESTPLDNIHWESSYVFMDGIGYWICRYDDDVYHRRPTNFIVFFDFETEVFGKIDAPHSFDQSMILYSANMFIGIVEDSLCLIDHMQSLDIWMMDKSCGQWFKKFSKVNSVEETLVEWLRPLQLLSSGEILMVSDDRNLVCYDMKTNCFTSINLHMERSNINVVTFVPNFMSLKDTIMGNSSEINRG